MALRDLFLLPLVFCVWQYDSGKSLANLLILANACLHLWRFEKAQQNRLQFLELLSEYSGILPIWFCLSTSLMFVPSY